MCLRIFRTLLTLSLVVLSSAAVNAQSGLVTPGAGLTPPSNTGNNQSNSSNSPTSSATTSSTTGTTGTTGNAAQQFIGGNATESFVGGAREATDQQGMNRQFQAFQTTETTTNSQSQQTGTPRKVRTVLSIGFQFPAAAEIQRSGRLASANSLSLSRFTSSKPEFSSVSVNLTGDGVAILTGTSPTTESSRLAANLIRLQPGVRKVNNQIAVAQ
jgi:hypothetical protein